MKHSIVTLLVSSACTLTFTNCGKSNDDDKTWQIRATSKNIEIPYVYSAEGRSITFAEDYVSDPALIENIQSGATESDVAALKEGCKYHFKKGSYSYSKTANGSVAVVGLDPVVGSTLENRMITGEGNQPPLIVLTSNSTSSVILRLGDLNTPESGKLILSCLYQRQ